MYAGFLVGQKGSEDRAGGCRSELKHWSKITALYKTLVFRDVTSDRFFVEFQSPEEEAQIPITWLAGGEIGKAF